VSLKERFGLESEFLIVHSGNMGVKQGLEVILGAAHLSRSDESLRYLLVGDGAVRENLESAACEMKLANVRFVPLLPDELYKELLKASDVSLVTQQKCVADIVFPSKVITLMASRRAIVASVSKTSEVARVLEEAKAGLVVPPGDSAKLLSAVISLRDNRSLRDDVAQNAREFARQNWNRDMILERMESQLVILLGKRAAKDTGGGRFWNGPPPRTSGAETSLI
jgi:colanic acid biosynthesis glycosyl transferase WcaI